MIPTEEQFQHKFNALRKQFLEQLPSKISILNSHWQTIKNENWSETSVDKLRFFVHSLIGTSGTFSYTDISSTARELEVLIKKISTQQGPPPQSEMDLVEQTFFTLCNEMLFKPGKTESSTSPTNLCCDVENKILIVDDDIETIHLLEDYLKLHGFSVEMLSHPAKLISTVREFEPSLILMDMVFEEGPLAGASAIEVLRDNGYSTPVIFISVNEDLSSRLSAIRTGAFAYLAKPLDLNLLLANIRSACELKPNKPYRVLLIDDDEDVLQVHAHALVDNGMIVRTLTDPMKTLVEAYEFKPELILLDMYMPKCTGLEVATILRQCSEFDDIPIIFLSSEQDTSLRMMAIKLGSDDFITKPVDLDYLCEAIQARIEKSRKLLATKFSDQVTIDRLKNEKKLAVRANRTKSEFISKMSHELRTPLNSILGYTQLLELDHDGTLTEQQKTNLEHILESGWHLLNLINDVLDISKIESSYLSLLNTEINLDSVIKKSLEMTTKQIADKNINITYNNDCGSDMTVYADKTRLQQVLVNILSNAIKFNKDNGNVDIDVTINNSNGCMISIKDTGRGLPEEDIHHLFTPFHRLGLEKTNIEGSGIGLALSAQLVELMEGEIGAHNNEGSGATVWFTLKQYSVAKNSQRGENDKIKILNIEENNMEIALMRQSIAAQSDIELFIARDAEAALHVATQIEPDVILLDLELSSMDGLSMLNALRTKSHLDQTPVFAISSKTIPSAQQSIKANEFYRYVSKPYNIEELLESIRLLQ